MHTGGVELIWSDLGTNGVISMSGDSSILEFHHRFKFPVEWDDEEFLLLSVNMVSTTGPMLSVSKSFGLGNSQGVENDVSLKHWSVVGAMVSPQIMNIHTCKAKGESQSLFKLI